MHICAGDAKLSHLNGLSELQVEGNHTHALQPGGEASPGGSAVRGGLLSSGRTEPVQWVHHGRCCARFGAPEIFKSGERTTAGEADPNDEPPNLSKQSGQFQHEIFFNNIYSFQRVKLVGTGSDMPLENVFIYHLKKIY